MSRGLFFPDTVYTTKHKHCNATIFTRRKRNTDIIKINYTCNL